VFCDKQELLAEMTAKRKDAKDAKSEVIVLGITVSRLELTNSSKSDPPTYGIIDPAKTRIKFSVHESCSDKVSLTQPAPISQPVDLKEVDDEAQIIGGLDKEISLIVRRTLLSRSCSPAIRQKLGIQHVKGLILYGPPGTGN
jgi:vesicle-fusing ATPase